MRSDDQSMWDKQIVYDHEVYVCDHCGYNLYPDENIEKPYRCPQCHKVMTNSEQFIREQKEQCFAFCKRPGG